MRNTEVVPPGFHWPPSSPHEMDVLKQHWDDRYSRLLREGGLTDELPVIGPPRTSRKVCFLCPHCKVVSYIKQKLICKAPPCHVISCWKCRGSFLISEIVLITDPNSQAEEQHLSNNER
jgi:hypothetical protein